MNRDLRDYQPSGTYQAPRGRQSIEELSLNLRFYCCFAYGGLGIFTCYKVESGKAINEKYHEEYIKTKTLTFGSRSNNSV